MLKESEKSCPYYESESRIFWQYVEGIGVYKGSSIPFAKYSQELIDQFDAMRWYQDFGKRDDDLRRRFAQKVGNIGVWRVKARSSVDHFDLSWCDFKGSYSSLYLEEVDL